MAGLVGERLGRLRLVEVAGRGGFATVYKAIDDGLDSVVAVKVLADNHSFDPDVRQRFLDEGRLLRRVHHPALLQVHDVGETPGHQPYLVMQYAAGGTLADRAGPGLAGAGLTGPGLTGPELVMLLEVLADGLGALHEAGVVHRDVTPANVLFVGGSSSGVSAAASAGAASAGAPGERLVIGDLGLAKDLVRSSGLTAGAGTSSFAAPEQSESGGVVGPAADVYGASMVLRWAAQDGPWADEVRRATERGVAQDAAKRPATMAVWRAELSELRQRLAAEAVPSVQPPNARPSRSWPPSALTPSALTPSDGTGTGRLVKAVGAALVFALATIGVVVGLGLRGGDEPAAVIVFDDGGLADGWNDQSWGVSTGQGPGEGTVNGFGAFSFAAKPAVAVNEEQWLVVEFAADENLGRWALRLNDGAGEALSLCVFQEQTNPVGDGTTRLAASLSALGFDGEKVSRVSLQNQSDQSGEVEVRLVTFGPATAWESPPCTPQG